MNKQQIKKNIDKTLKGWLASIDDYQVRYAVRDSLVVTGGCIASMLLDQPVQDYDIYLRDVKVAKALADYYIRKVKSSHCFEVDISARAEHNSVIVKNAPVSLKEYTLHTPLYISKNAITLCGCVQIVLRFCGAIEDIHKTFDFVHSKNYYADDELVLDPESLESILTKELRYVGSGFPLCALFRVFKFIKRGWKIHPAELMKIGYDISKLNLENPDVLQEQLGGVYGARVAKEISVYRRITRADYFEILTEHYNPANPSHDGNYK